jgi:hypothetical protein
MNPPLVKIVLDEPSGVFPCGAAINGVVNVAVHEECEGRKLIIAVGYRESGIAPNQTIKSFKDTETKQLFTGAWQPGTYNYRFSLSAPEACNYAGVIMNVSWYLRAGVGAHAATSFDVETEDEKGINLVPAEVSPADREAKKTSEVVRRESAGFRIGCFLSSIALFFGGLFFAWLGLGHDASLPGLVAALMGLAVLGVIVRQALIDKKIAMTELRIGSVVVWPGVAVPCSITVQAKVPTEIENATITLEGWEHVKQYTGMYRSTGPVNKHMVHTEEKALELPARTLPAQVPVRLKGNFVIPAGATCTMDFDNEVKFLWRVELRIKLKGSPDWFDVQPITVMPRIGNDN